VRDVPHHRRRRGALGRQPWLVALGAACEHQRERVAADDAVDALRLAGAHARRLQQRLRVGGREALDAQHAHELSVLAAPGGGRRLAAREDDPDAVGQAGDEDRAHPRVEHREELVGVDDQEDTAAGVQRRALERAAQAVLRWLDPTRVERDHGGAGVPRAADEPPQQRRLADACDPMDVGDDWRAGTESLLERRPLPGPADEVAGTLVEQRLERRGHRLADRNRGRQGRRGLRGARSAAARGYVAGLAARSLLGLLAPLGGLALQAALVVRRLLGALRRRLGARPAVFARWSWCHVGRPCSLRWGMQPRLREGEEVARVRPSKPTDAAQVWRSSAPTSPNRSSWPR
jgi:hypothetical protein